MFKLCGGRTRRIHLHSYRIPNHCAKSIDVGMVFCLTKLKLKVICRQLTEHNLDGLWLFWLGRGGSLCRGRTLGATHGANAEDIVRVVILWLIAGLIGIVTEQAAEYRWSKGWLEKYYCGIKNYHEIRQRTLTCCRGSISVFFYIYVPNNVIMRLLCHRKRKHRKHIDRTWVGTH